MFCDASSFPYVGTFACRVVDGGLGIAKFVGQFGFDLCTFLGSDGGVGGFGFAFELGQSGGEYAE